MGACEFKTRSSGKTAAEAYQAARAHARDYNGHQDGYSGDIQTTHGFVMLSVPEGKTEREFIDHVLENDLHGVEKWGSAGCIDRGPKPGLPEGHREFVFFGWAAE